MGFICKKKLCVVTKGDRVRYFMHGELVKMFHVDLVLGGGASVS